jgi:hypothetical protein
LIELFRNIYFAVSGRKIIAAYDLHGATCTASSELSQFIRKADCSSGTLDWAERTGLIARK